MTNTIKFTFLAQPDDLTALTKLAGACDRSRAAMLRKLIRDADRLQKNPPTTQSLPADVVDGLDNRSLSLETNSHAKSTTIASG